MARQTSIDYMSKWVKRNMKIDEIEFDKIFKKAKKMEKTQIEDAWELGFWTNLNQEFLGGDLSGKEYYKSLYKK